MEKTTLNKLDLDVYSTKLNNGLEVYIVPKNDFNNIYVTFSSKYGSKHNEFIPINENKMIKVPDGIAHFLEHKIFEQSDGTDAFTFFSQSGTDANANTSKTKTTYLFSGTNSYEDNLNFLLDYVQDPYFTDENVKKEKGIIEQEINMYQDNPDYILYDKSLLNTIVKDPTRIPIAGTIESINKITKEDLYICYHTFYHPSNMFLVITGNVDVEKSMEIIKINQDNKEFVEANEVETKKVKEPDNVLKEYEVINMTTSIPKLAINFKLNFSKVKVSLEVLSDYLSIYFGLKFGATSDFGNRMIKSGNIIGNFAYTSLNLDKHKIMTLFAETKNPDELIDYIKEEISNFNIKEEDFERRKKTILSSYIFISDNIYRINNKIMGDINKYGKIKENDYDEIQALNYEDFKNTIESLNFDKTSIVIVKK